MTMFYYILDTIRVNSQTIFTLLKGETPGKTQSIDVGFQLVMSLTRPHMERRPLQGLQTSVINKIKMYLPTAKPPANPDLLPRDGRKKENAILVWRMSMVLDIQKLQTI